MDGALSTERIVNELYSKGLLAHFDFARSNGRVQVWFKLFVKHFIDQPHPLAAAPCEADDILFFVRDLSLPAGQQPSPVFVKRKVENSCTLPTLDAAVNWEETFYLNLITQMRYYLRVSLCYRDANDTLLVARQVTRHVFAMPSMCVPKSRNPECSYPLVCFAVNDFEECFGSFVLGPGSALCVELVTTFGSALLATEPLDLNLVPFSSLEAERDRLLLFQGAVQFSALASVYSAKAGQSVGSTEYVLMRGPHGKGNAQVAISAPFAQASSQGRLSHVLHRAWHSVWSAKSPKVPERLVCRLTFVNLHWRLIVLELFKHFAKAGKGLSIIAQRQTASVHDGKEEAGLE